MTMIIIMTLEGADRDFFFFFFFFFTIVSLRLEMSTARRLARKSGRLEIGCLSRDTCLVPRATRKQLSC